MALLGTCVVLCSGLLVAVNQLLNFLLGLYVLLALGGLCVKALDNLNRAFESRIREGEFQSAWRLLLAQLQVRAIVGDRWFSDVKPLLLHYANQRIYKGKGVTTTVAAFALLQAGEPRRTIALLSEETPADAIDEAWRGYMLAAAPLTAMIAKSMMPYHMNVLTLVTADTVFQFFASDEEYITLPSAT